MDRISKSLSRLAIPDLPADMRDDFVVGAAQQVQKQAQWLFLALLCTTPFAVLATPAGMGWLVRWGLPAAMAGYCLFGLYKLRHVHTHAHKPRFAARFVVEASLSSSIGALICTSWAVLSWLGAEGTERLHFPVILVMGSLATAYCLASVRLGAIIHLVIDIGPIATLLVTSGSMLDLAAGVSMALAGMFQWRMINVHQRQVIELLRLKRHNQQLARTDPLTGLMNRRALLDQASELGQGMGQSRLLLIDIDRFKSINDRHGHELGDQVLCAIAGIIASHAGESVCAARLGGEEFALFGPVEALPAATALALLAQIREAAMPHGEVVTVSIGIAEGQTASDEAWRTLYREADAALFAAKHEGRNRYSHATLPPQGEPNAKDVGKAA